MSQEILTEFMAKAQADEKLMAEVKDAIENSEGPDKFVALGKKNGYDFTETEVVQLFFPKRDNDELSEAELSAAAGGAITKPYQRIPNSWGAGQLSNPLVLGAIIATAIAIPIAVQSSQDEGS